MLDDDKREGSDTGAPSKALLLLLIRRRKSTLPLFALRLRKLKSHASQLKKLNHVAQGLSFITIRQMWGFIKGSQLTKLHVCND